MGMQRLKNLKLFTNGGNNVAYSNKINGNVELRRIRDSDGVRACNRSGCKERKKYCEMQVEYQKKFHFNDGTFTI
jgi:hypothetical protein